MGYSANTFTYPQYNWSTPTFTSSSQTSKKEETYEEYQKRLEKERKEYIKKREENLKLFAEYNEKIKALKEEKKQNIDENLIEKAKKDKVNADGTITHTETMGDYRKLPWWKKTLRAGSSMIQGAWKLATGLFGYETDPKTGESKWHFEKLLKNAAIAGVCIGLTFIPVVGPFIGLGLLAFGIGSGVYQTGKGIIKANKANTPKEIDEAFQDIGAGVIVGLSSAAGLRGVGKSLQASAASTASADAGAAASSASTASSATSAGAAAGTTASTASSAVRSVGRFQYLRDCTINAGRATLQNAKAGKQALRSNINGMTGWKSTWGIRHIGGFCKTYAQNVKAALPKTGETKFKNAKDELNKSIDERLSEIKTRQDAILEETYKTKSVSDALDFEDALLDYEQAILKAQKTQINDAVTRNQYKLLRKRPSAQKAADKLMDVAYELKHNNTAILKMPNGRAYKMTLDQNEHNLQALMKLANKAKETAKEVEKLAKLRTSTIRTSAFKSNSAAQVHKYTGKTRTNKFARIYDTTPKFTWKTPFKLVWDAINIPFKPWEYVKRSPASTGFKIEQAIVPDYEQGDLIKTVGDTFGWNTWGDKLMTVEIPAVNEKGEIVKDEKGNIVKQKTPLTKDLLAQLEEAQKQYDKSIAELEQKQTQLNVA